MPEMWGRPRSWERAGKVQLPVRLDGWVADWLRREKDAGRGSMNKNANDFIVDGIVLEELRRAGEEIDVPPGAYGKILRQLRAGKQVPDGI